MQPQSLLTTVFERVRQAPLGTDNLPELTPNEVFESAEHFTRLLWRDPSLVKRHINDFAALDRYVTECARQKVSTSLTDDARKALVILSYLFSRMHEQRGIRPESSDRRPVVVELGSDQETIAKNLAEIGERNKYGKLAEGCILNAAFSCTNADVLLAAGRYYLELINAEVTTAIPYFMKASTNNKAVVGTCDQLLNQFWEVRTDLYFGMARWECAKQWEDHKRSL